MSRVALVTGGAKRLGRAICLDLAAHGYTVVVHYLHSRQEALQTQELCLAQGVPNAYVLGCDLSQKEQRATLMARAIDAAGRVDLLVNSASMFEYDNADSFSADALEAHLQTNYLAPVELTMALFEHAKSNPGTHKAHALSLLDQKLFNLNVDYLSYTLAKQANHASIRYLAQCCAPHLRVNAVAPGLTEVSGAKRTLGRPTASQHSGNRARHRILPKLFGCWTMPMPSRAKPSWSMVANTLSPGGAT